MKMAIGIILLAIGASFVISIIGITIYNFVKNFDEEKDKRIKRKKAFEELRYKEPKESEFWAYFNSRNPEFEERIAKMNELMEREGL